MNTSRLTAVGILIFAVAFVLLAASPRPAHSEPPEATIAEWNIQWIMADDARRQAPSPDGPWETGTENRPVTTIPDGAVGAWIRLVMPPTTDWLKPGLLIERLYGLQIAVYEGSQIVHDSARDFDFERNNLLLPVTPSADPTELLVRIESKERAGISSPVRVGEFDRLSELFVRTEMPNLLLGSSIAFLAVVMLICSGYLNRSQRRSWVALSVFALSTGSLIVTYSALPYIYLNEFGHVLLMLFDTSMYALFPALYFYVVPTFEGKYRFFATFGRWFSIYSAFCFVVTVVYKLVGDPFYFYYKLFTYWILAPLIFVLLLSIVVLSIVNAIRGSRNSIILSGGILLFALSAAADLVLFSLTEGRHLLFLWKVGIVVMIASLVLVLARRISSDYAKLLSYSKELEMYNHQLQRTEKLKIISDLAASIAHEVRNPMQVTRGFLQLLSGKSDPETKYHFTMAISELDRASDIITDFLTFAKPELDTIVPMNLQQEMGKIESIMSPMAMMNGGVLLVRVPDNLYILGNPSKFKQAFINMIKNSIESLREDGKIEIKAHAERDIAIIRITDNGEGMEEEQLAKLGEPFFSTKTKGTGLGLMVTFRIIEVMKGTLEFRSAKGKGTEAIVRFPLAGQD